MKLDYEGSTSVFPLADGQSITIQHDRPLLELLGRDLLEAIKDLSRNAPLGSITTTVTPIDGDEHLDFVRDTALNPKNR